MFITSALPSFTEVKLCPADGSVTVYYPHMYRGLCRLDMTFYPFDEQLCVVTFWSVLKPLQMLDIWPSSSILTHSEYQQHNEWVIVDVVVKREVDNAETEEFLGEVYPLVRYTIRLHRQPLFYVINLALPAALCAFVAVFSIFPPGGSAHSAQDRAQIGLMALLYCAIQLLAVSQEMPVTSYVVPVISIYFGLLLTVIASSTLIQSISISLAKEELSRPTSSRMFMTPTDQLHTAPTLGVEKGDDQQDMITSGGRNGLGSYSLDGSWPVNKQTQPHVALKWKRRNRVFLIISLLLILSDIIWFLSHYAR